MISATMGDDGQRFRASPADYLFVIEQQDIVSIPIPRSGKRPIGHISRNPRTKYSTPSCARICVLIL